MRDRRRSRFRGNVGPRDRHSCPRRRCIARQTAFAFPRKRGPSRSHQPFARMLTRGTSARCTGPTTTRALSEPGQREPGDLLVADRDERRDSPRVSAALGANPIGAMRTRSRDNPNAQDQTLFCTRPAPLPQTARPNRPPEPPARTASRTVTPTATSSPSVTSDEIRRASARRLERTRSARCAPIARQSERHFSAQNQTHETRRVPQTARSNRISNRRCNRHFVAKRDKRRGSR